MKEDYPKEIYKYRYFDDEGHALDMIKKGEIWLSSARNFNDPFDTAITHSFDELYEPIAEDWARAVVKREIPYLAPDELETYVSKKLSEIRNDSDYIKRAKDRIIEIQYNKFGICAFSESYNNILLWSHYARNHTGVCIGFDINVIINYANQIAEREKELLDLVKVRYSNEYPKFSLFKSVLNEDDLTDIFNLLYTKSSNWSYEKEYRMIYWGKTNFSIQLGSKAISKVILGCCITSKHRENILEICSSLNNSPSVYQAIKNNNVFSLELEKIL